ncbi:MAG: glutamate-5-semialdehyde dehydrogenase [Actinomycetota bacterium]
MLRPACILCVSSGGDRIQESTPSTQDTCRAAKAASRKVALLHTDVKNRVLGDIAEELADRAEQILEANAKDVAAGRAEGLSKALTDRLTLTPERIERMEASIRQIVGLADPVGQVVTGWRLPNGVEIRKVRVPLGVVAMIYEARPNVTVDAACLALKSGNTCVLRGSSSAYNSNRELVTLIRDVLAGHGIAEDAVALVEDTSRDSVADLLNARGLVDVLIPRGGPALIARVARDARVPVIIDGAGNCHVFVDAAADLAKARGIVVNGKTFRPSVCNATETLLVDRIVAGDFLPDVCGALGERDVELVGDDAARAIVEMGAATDTDFAEEFLDYKLAVAVVDGLDGALDHIVRYGTGHTEAIVTEDREAARRFQAEVDAAVVAVNTSTSFTDGGEFGFGAEIGISTQKLHARGPMALPELTTIKYLVDGDGQVRR